MVELGSYDGYLPSILLVRRSLKHWHGFDIAPVEQVCKNMRYTSVPMLRPFDKEELPEFTTFVSAHTMEHLSWSEVSAVMARLDTEKISKMVLEIPFYDGRGSWHRDRSLHVLKKTSKRFLQQAIVANGWEVVFENRIESIFVWGCTR